MKTSLTCLAILIIALVLGNLQGARLENLKQQIPSSKAASRSKAYERESTDRAPVYRSKYQRTSNNAVAKEVFQTVIECLAERTSTTTGPLASMTDRNKNALKAVLQLDRSGLEGLITMISQSKDPALTRISAAKYEQITLCIIALADQDPGYALDYVTDAGKEMDPKVFRDYGTGNWLDYILTRLGDSDPQRALDGLLKVAGDSAEPWGDDRVLTLLAKVACQDPGLVLETIDRLPEMKSQYFLESLAFQMESDDERTALFQALRDRYPSQHESMRAGLASLFGRFRNARESPAEIRRWADSLGMTDSEKFLIFDRLNDIEINERDGEEYARWFAKFMPESNERKRLVWKACTYWDSENTMAFLAEQGIDPQEMNRLGRDEN